MSNIKAAFELRYDTYENWFSEKGRQVILKRGELGFCSVENDINPENLKPGVYFKVGNNADTYETLPWFKASWDVPEYIKADEEHFIDWINKALLDTENVVYYGVKEATCPWDASIVTGADIEFIYGSDVYEGTWVSIFGVVGTLKDGIYIPGSAFKTYGTTITSEYAMNITFTRSSLKEEILSYINTIKQVEETENYEVFSGAPITVENLSSVQITNPSSYNPVVVRWTQEQELDLTYSADKFLGTWKVTPEFYNTLSNFDATINVNFYTNGKFYTAIVCGGGQVGFKVSSTQDVVYNTSQKVLNNNYLYLTFGQSAKEKITNDFYVYIGAALEQHGEKTTLQKVVPAGFYTFPEDQSWSQYAKDMPEGEFAIKFKSKGEWYDGVLEKKGYKSIGNRNFYYLF